MATRFRGAPLLSTVGRTIGWCRLSTAPSRGACGPSLSNGHSVGNFSTPLLKASRGPSPRGDSQLSCARKLLLDPLRPGNPRLRKPSLPANLSLDASSPSAIYTCPSRRRLRPMASAPREPFLGRVFSSLDLRGGRFLCHSCAWVRHAHRTSLANPDLPWISSIFGGRACPSLSFACSPFSCLALVEHSCVCAPWGFPFGLHPFGFLSISACVMLPLVEHLAVFFCEVKLEL